MPSKVVGNEGSRALKGIDDGFTRIRELLIGMPKRRLDVKIYRFDGAALSHFQYRAIAWLAG